MVDEQFLHPLVPFGVSRRHDSLSSDLLLLDELTFSNVGVDDVHISNDLRDPFVLDLFRRRERRERVSDATLLLERKKRTKE